MRARALLALPLILAAAAITPRATAADAGVAALQVGLRSHGLYQGPIDGLTGPGTAKAIRRLQKRAHITVDGVVGPQTRKALGRFARHRLGTAQARARQQGPGRRVPRSSGLPNMASAWGPPMGSSARTSMRPCAASRMGLAPQADGVAGSATLAALLVPPPTIPLPPAWPMTAPVSATLGPPRRPLALGHRPSRADGCACLRRAVRPSRLGRVARRRLGILVVVAHGHGERSMYAHVTDRRAPRRLGRTGSGGSHRRGRRRDGPHLHFEVRVRSAPWILTGAAVTPRRTSPGRRSSPRTVNTCSPRNGAQLRHPRSPYAPVVTTASVRPATRSTHVARRVPSDRTRG